ncbi:MAG: putative adenylyltransferase/sulfurtransferase MoeZ [Bryobacteraceae bacterium]|nr:putative adenylyltransferase/sulfurtransferase MoeZ [Bryobacteraceae bacterium]
MTEELPLEITPRETRNHMDSGLPVLLIDCREPHEHAICRIEGAQLIPMNTVPTRLQEIDSAAGEGRVIVYCHHGMRSLSVVSWLRRQGVERCQSLSGGIEQWSLEIDPSVPRY